MSLVAVATLGGSLGLWAMRPRPSRFPFLQGLSASEIDRREVEMWDHFGHHRLDVRAYRVGDPDGTLRRRLDDELFSRRDWTLGGLVPNQPGVGFTAKDGRAAVAFSRLPPRGSSKGRGIDRSPGVLYISTYEDVPPSSLEPLRRWLRTLFR